MDYGTIDFDYAAYLSSRPAEEDGPVWMVNFMRYRKVAAYQDGGTEISGKEADDRYAPVKVLREIGADVAFFGDVVDESDWDRMAIIRYPTRAAFIDMQSRQDFKEQKVHKDAGMEFTIIMGGIPAETNETSRDESGVVTFIGIPKGSAYPDSLGGAVKFEVEGTIIGDERRWDYLAVLYSDSAPEGLPEGSMVVASTSQIDGIASLLGL